MADLTGLTFTNVVGRFLAGIGDGVDAGTDPDFPALSGTITLRPEPPKILVPNGSPDPATVVWLAAHYECTLDSSGYLTWNGSRGAKVIVPSPSTTNPNNFTYRVTFDLYYGTDPVPIAPYSFYLAASGDTDLTKVSPVPGSIGTAVTQGASISGVTLVGDALVFQLDTGATLPPVTVPTISASAASAAAAAASASAAAGSASAASGSATAASGSASSASSSAAAAAATAASFGLSIGTVTTVAAGGSATAAVHGGPPAYVIDLGIPTGATGASSTWRAGAGVPSSGVGNNGDMYINTSNGDVYGPKASGAWGSVVINIIGPAAADATTSSKGIVQLSGILAGTAAAPTFSASAFGTSSTTAARGDDSRITGAVQGTRQVIAGTGLTGGGDLTADRTFTVAYGTSSTTAARGDDSRLSNTRTPTTGTVPYDVNLMAFGKSTTRTSATPTGDNPFGVKLQRAVTFTSVTYRGATADASGNSTFELRKNGSQVSGTNKTVAAADQTAGGANATATGTWAFAAGDVLTLACTAVGTTPGAGLIADITGLA